MEPICPAPLQMPWIESPYFDPSALPPDVRRLAENLARDGMTTFDPLLPDFEQTAESIIEGLRGQYRGQSRVYAAWRFHEGVRRLATAPRVLEILRLLYGREPIPYSTLNFEVGTEQPTHSDVIHFHSVPSRFMAGVWIALEDIDSENGPLHYYPGSHRLPLVLPEDLGIDRTLTTLAERHPVYETYMERFLKQTGWTPMTFEARKGTALLWTANLLHGGSTIRDRHRTRHSQVTHYFFSGCQYYSPLRSSLFKRHIHYIDFDDIRTGRPVTQPKAEPWLRRVRQALARIRR